MIVNIIKARQSFAEMAELDDVAFPLDRVALTLAMEEYPDMNILQYLKRLDTLARRRCSLSWAVRRWYIARSGSP